MANKVLYLEKRGCNFSPSDTELLTFSDVGNYRLCTMDYNIMGKDGKMYFLEVTSCQKRRFTNKRTGAKLKKMVVEHNHKLYISTAYQEPSKDGFLMTWGNINLDSIIYNLELDYTKKDILAAVNLISSDNYTDVVIID